MLPSLAAVVNSLHGFGVKSFITLFRTLWAQYGFHWFFLYFFVLWNNHGLFVIFKIICAASGYLRKECLHSDQECLCIPQDVSGLTYKIVSCPGLITRIAWDKMRKLSIYIHFIFPYLDTFNHTFPYMEICS